MLTTFLLVSLRKLSEFTPSRVRLVRVDIQKLETELDSAPKELILDFVDKSGYQQRDFENTILGRQLSVRLEDVPNPIQYIPFMQGAQQLLKELRPDEKFEPQSIKIGSEIDQELTVSQIMDESLVKPQISTPCAPEDESAKKKKERNGTEVFFYNEDRCGTSRRFNELCRGTVSQLQFWMMKGLDEIESTKTAVHTQEYYLIKELLKTLLYYLQPMVQMVVKPILVSPDPVEHVHIAQRCHRIFQFLEGTAKNPFETSVLNQLRRTLRVDWIDMVSILEETNRQVIHRHQKVRREGWGENCTTKIFKSSFRTLDLSHPLLRYEQSSTCRVRWGKKDADQQVPIILSANEPLETEHRPNFDLARYRSKLVLISKPNPIESNSSSPIKVTVKLNQLEFIFKAWHFSNKFMVILESYYSRLRFTTIDAIMALLDNASRQPERHLEVESFELFENVELSDDINSPKVWENQNIHWRLLQQGIVQFNLAGTWIEGFTDDDTSYEIGLHYMMHYIDLSGSGHKRAFSKFDLTTCLLAENSLIESGKFKDLSLITKCHNKFFFSLLEIGDDMFIQTTPRNLHLAQFAVEGRQLVSLNYSVFQFTTAQLAMLDQESSCSFCNSGALQWLVKNNKYFSISYLQSSKYCIWVHMFHKDRFQPIGPRRIPVPGLTQLGTCWSPILIEKKARDLSVAFSEKLEMLRRKKTVYRLFALTPKW